MNTLKTLVGLLALLWLPAGAQAEWLSEISAQVQPRWQGSFLLDCTRLLKGDHPLNDGTLALTVHIATQPTGQLASVYVQSSSGLAAFDRAALDVIRDSAPWAQPPEGALSDDGLAHVDWPLFRDPARQQTARPELVWVRWPLSRIMPALLEQHRWQAALDRLAAPSNASQAQLRQFVDAIAQAMAPAPATTRKPATAPTQSVAELLAVLAHTPPSAPQYAAARALGDTAHGQLGPATSALRKCITHDDPQLRVAALEGLIRAGVRSKGLFYRVIPLVHDPVLDVRAAALQAMAITGGARAETDLLLLSRKAKRTKMRLAAVRALAHLPGDGARKRLQRMSRQGPPAQQLAARVALAQWGSVTPGWQALNPSPRQWIVLRGAEFKAAERAGGLRGAINAFAKGLRSANTPQAKAQLARAWLWATTTRPPT
jgi:TonB family protein